MGLAEAGMAVWVGRGLVVSLDEMGLAEAGMVVEV